jgi:glycosyltransferase involved in cell wall biosynthesis
MSLVSVVATVLNEVEDIGGLVSTLTGQTLAAAEVIVVDGGSADGTWEWLEAARARYPTLVAIRDESCSLKYSPGPIARGRNVGIRAASSDVIACADAGCTYGPDWLGRLAGPILEGGAEYAVGGSCIDVADSTVWDIASAPFFGVKLSADEPTKSCTARSMAFRKELWERMGGFPETVFFGEDTLFDQRVRATVTPVFAERAKAVYRPRYTFQSAVRQLARYAIADGAMGVRPARLMRNLMRCVVEVLAVAALPFTVIPFVLIFALEIYFAFRLDWREIRKASVGVWGARLVFSLVVPWVVTWNQIVGGVTKAHQPNRQNVG